MNEYDKVYSQKADVFGGAELMLQKISVAHPGEALDLGAGQGRNSLFLAESGWKVTAVDVSAVAMKELEEEATRLALPLRTIQQDIRDFSFQESYDLIIVSLVLHFLKIDEAEKLIQQIQDHTNAGGHNFFLVVTKQGDFFKSNPDSWMFYPEIGGVKEFYKDWEIVDFESRKRRARQTFPDGSPMFNISDSLLVKKTK